VLPSETVFQTYPHQAESVILERMNQPSKNETARAALHEELQNFHRFADQKLEVAGYESLEELLGLWRANHPLAKESPQARSARAKAGITSKPDDPKKSAVPYL
jgi:hypothetical protein